MIDANIVLLFVLLYSKEVARRAGGFYLHIITEDFYRELKSPTASGPPSFAKRDINSVMLSDGEPS